MKKKETLWLAGAAAVLIGAVLLLSFLSTLSREKACEAAAIPAETGAAFDAVPVAEMLLHSPKGDVWLSDLEGTPVVLHFFSPGTEPGEELTLINDLSLQYEEKVLFLPVCEAEERAAAEALFAANGIALPLYTDGIPSAKEACAITQVPSTVFIDAGGFLAARSQGAVEAEAMLFGISLIAPKDTPS